MFKLLTDEERDKVAHEYKMRRAIVMLLAVTIILVSGIIGLMPSYILSSAREDEVLARTRALTNDEQLQQAVSAQAWIKEINQELKTLAPKLDKDRPSESVKGILKYQTQGISITGFSWKKDRGKTLFSITGIASSRQSLINFENSIKGSDYFSDVDLPISNLAEDKNISFKISATPTTTPALNTEEP